MVAFESPGGFVSNLVISHECGITSFKAPIFTMNVISDQPFLLQHCHT